MQSNFSLHQFIKQQQLQHNCCPALHRINSRTETKSQNIQDSVLWLMHESLLILLEPWIFLRVMEFPIRLRKGQQLSNFCPCCLTTKLRISRHFTFRPYFNETPYVVIRYCDTCLWTERGRIIKGFLDHCCLAFVKNLPSQWMKRSFRSFRRSNQKISSTVLVSFLSQHVLKEIFKFLEESINSLPHCWVISTGDATETELVTALTTWFCFCENSLQHKREEGRKKSLEKATWSSWSGRMFVLS